MCTETLRRAIFSESRPRYEPWERPPYREFPNRVLILGGGFAGYTAAKTLCRLTRHRDDVGLMLTTGRSSSPTDPCVWAPSAPAQTPGTSTGSEMRPDPRGCQLPAG